MGYSPWGHQGQTQLSDFTFTFGWARALWAEEAAQQSLRQPSGSEEGGDDGGPRSLLRESRAFPQRREEQGTGWADRTTLTLHGAWMGQGQAAGGAE